MTTIINGKEVPDNTLSFFRGILVVKYIIEGEASEVHLADGTCWVKETSDPFGEYKQKEEPCQENKSQ